MPHNHQQDLGRAELKFDAFKDLLHISKEDICRRFFLENRESIRIKKEDVAVRNLVKIFDAALAISNKKGFPTMSMRDLSAGTGLSMGALYNCFSSKDDLLDMIQEQGRTVVIKILTDCTSGVDDPRQKLRRTVQTHLYLSEVMQPWFYFSYMETKNLGKEEHKRAIESELATEKVFLDIIEEGISSGIFSPVDAGLTAAAIKATLQDWYLKRWKYERRKVTVEDYSHFLVDFIESYILTEKN